MKNREKSVKNIKKSSEMLQKGKRKKKISKSHQKC